jgi:hypothetical protein
MYFFDLPYHELTIIRNYHVSLFQSRAFQSEDRRLIENGSVWDTPYGRFLVWFCPCDQRRRLRILLRFFEGRTNIRAFFHQTDFPTSIRQWFQDALMRDDYCLVSRNDTPHPNTLYTCDCNSMRCPFSTRGLSSFTTHLRLTLLQDQFRVRITEWRSGISSNQCCICTYPPSTPTIRVTITTH